ncbi:prepilin peptidase [Campylobacter sp. RM9753]|nr:prepilin peptidase [Campylobacter sp. RM9753]
MLKFILVRLYFLVLQKENLKKLSKNIEKEREHLEGENLIEEILKYIFLIILGFSLGSFCMCFLNRFCENKPLLSARSYCFSCHKKLSIIDLIPFLSYIFLKARCRFCKEKIPIGIFLAEILGMVFVLIAYFFSKNLLEFLVFSLYLFVFWMLSYIDIKFKAVPQILLWVLFFLALIFKLNINEFFYFFIFEDFKSGFLIQAFSFAGFLFLLKNFTGYIKNFRSKNIQENLGDADIIVCASIAGIFGFKESFIILFCGALLTLPFFIFYKTRELAFLPFINIAFIGYVIFLIFNQGLA